jgi:hypothetical protein
LTNCGEVEKARIEERLRQLDDRLLPRQGQWDDNQSWLINAETEHYRRLFHAILAKFNPRELDFILEGDSLDETHPLWNVPTSQTVPRIAEEMAACIAPLLRVSQEILFIDPHFGPENARHRRSLEAFLVAVVKYA